MAQAQTQQADREEHSSVQTDYAATLTSDMTLDKLFPSPGPQSPPSVRTGGMCKSVYYRTGLTAGAL